MATYKKESHTRSILKGISWRMIAFVDTIVIVLLVTCIHGNCSIDQAIKIGAAEFILKFLVYYVHERIWQRVLRAGKVTSRETLYKTISWRIVASGMTFVISGVVLNVYGEIAFYIALTELFTKFALYYVHERLWLKLPLGKIRSYFSKK